MKTAAILSMLAGLVASVAATAMPASDVSYPKGTKVEVFPDGLPKHLIPRALDLEKRDNVGVYLCNDRNFSGFCKHIVAPLYKRVNLGGDLNDQVSPVGPDSGYCFFFR